MQFLAWLLTCPVVVRVEAVQKTVEFPQLQVSMWFCPVIGQGCCRALFVQRCAWGGRAENCGCSAVAAVWTRLCACPLLFTTVLSLLRRSTCGVQLSDKLVDISLRVQLPGFVGRKLLEFPQLHFIDEVGFTCPSFCSDWCLMLRRSSFFWEGGRGEPSMANNCWLSRARRWLGRQGSDSQVFCHPKSVHARAAVSTEASSLHHVRTTTTTTTRRLVPESQQPTTRRWSKESQQQCATQVLSEH